MTKIHEKSGKVMSLRSTAAPIREPAGSTASSDGAGRSTGSAIHSTHLGSSGDPGIDDRVSGQEFRSRNQEVLAPEGFPGHEGIEGKGVGSGPDRLSSPGTQDPRKQPQNEQNPESHFVTFSTERISPPPGSAG
uniref:ORF133 n=1 Tax=Leptospirillum ferrooxidans TaxID=180 RepID=Q58KF4_9BACT|nr:ORF133 [Leptospirillum ferrooxidans]